MWIWETYSDVGKSVLIDGCNSLGRRRDKMIEFVAED